MLISITDLLSVAVSNTLSLCCREYALDSSGNIDRPGNLNWKMMLCNLFGWVIVFLVLCRGIKSLGKVIIYKIILISEPHPLINSLYSDFLSSLSLSHTCRIAQRASSSWPSYLMGCGSKDKEGKLSLAPRKWQTHTPQSLPTERLGDYILFLTHSNTRRLQWVFSFYSKILFCFR